MNLVRFGLMLALMFSSPLKGVEVDIIKRFNLINSLLRVKIVPPEGFFLNPRIADEANLLIVAPLDSRGEMIRGFRYSNERHPFATIALVSYFTKYDPKRVLFSKEDLEKKRILILSVEPKRHGAPGLLVHAKHWIHQRWFEKWIALFGNRRQTAVVSGAFPQDTGGEVMSRIMRRAVEYSEFTTKSEIDE